MSPISSTKVYHCPLHGLIESPTWHDDEIPEDSGFYCPINLTGQPQARHDGITDEVCGKDVTAVIVPTCTVESRYWRDGLRWEVVLQVMYRGPRGHGGPYFVIGHTWREATARAMVEKANFRLARSEEEMRGVLSQ